MIENLNSQSGWIKIDRRLTAHWLWADDRFLKWWLDLLMMAQYSQRKVLIGHTLVRLERGQLAASERFLRNRWSRRDAEGNTIKPSLHTVRRFITLLVNDEMIKVDNEKLPNRQSLISIVNYAKYQDVEPTPSNTDSITDSITHDITDSNTDSSTGSIKTKEYKEYKKIKQNKEECIGDDAAEEGVVDKQQRDARSQGGGKVCRKKSFTPPEVKEVADWLSRKGWTDIDAEHFVAYYESNGWMIGRSPMRNWQAALVTWHRKNTSANTNPCQSTLNVNTFNRNHYESDFDRQRAEKSRRDAEFLAHIHAKLARSGALPETIGLQVMGVGHSISQTSEA